MSDATAGLAGKQCLITGATGGIGLWTAKGLAARGADLILVGRDPARGRAAVAEIEALCTPGAVAFIACDLADQEQIRALAAELSRRGDRLDVLVNNAGAMFGRRQESRQGIEMTFAVNHLGYFLLTLMLLPLLAAAKPARIVNVASEAHRGVRLDLDDLQARRRYSAWRAYRRSKLANLLFTHELARRLDWQEITANALHPGFVATEIGVRHGFVNRVFWEAFKLVAIGAEAGAATSVYLASAPEVQGAHGRYFIKCRPANPSAASHDRAAAAALWEESVRLTGLSSEELPQPLGVTST